MTPSKSSGLCSVNFYYGRFRDVRALFFLQLFGGLLVYRTTSVVCQSIWISLVFSIILSCILRDSYECLKIDIHFSN